MSPDFDCRPTNEVRDFGNAMAYTTSADEGTSILDNEQSPWRDMEKMINSLKLQVTSVSQAFRQLEKANHKTIAQLKKDSIKSKPKIKSNKSPSGFAKPSKISKELGEFMEKSEGELVARTEVTQFIIAYIKDNNLAESKNINPDKKLQQLLGSTDDDKISYFNIQKFMNKHFIKQ